MQTKFLQGLAVGGTHKAGIRASGSKLRTIRRWRSENTLGFGDRYKNAKDSFCDSLEDIAFALVKDLKNGQTPILLQHMLNANMPEKYSRNVIVSDDTAQATLDLITKHAKKLVNSDANKERAREATPEDKVVSFLDRKSG